MACSMCHGTDVQDTCDAGECYWEYLQQQERERREEEERYLEFLHAEVQAATPDHTAERGGVVSHWETPGASDEWYTPPHVFSALGVAFDLDVAPARHGTSHVPAAKGCWTDGLSEDWQGFVWMNPPFGARNSLGPWLDRFFAHGNGIALTPDRTSAPWFHQAWANADAVMFTRKIRFLRPDGSEGKSPSNGTALWACGNDAVRSLEQAGSLGILAYPATHQPNQEMQS